MALNLMDSRAMGMMSWVSVAVCMFLASAMQCSAQLTYASPPAPPLAPTPGYPPAPPAAPWGYPPANSPYYFRGNSPAYGPAYSPAYTSPYDTPAYSPAYSPAADCGFFGAPGPAPEGYPVPGPTGEAFAPEGYPVPPPAYAPLSGM